MKEQTTETKKRSAPHRKWDILAKILCVLAAFVLWVYVMSVESPEHEEPFSHITVELENVEQLTDKSLAVYNGYGTMIDVTLAGKKSVISKLKEEDIVATADVGDIDASGRYSCKVTVDVPSGCKLVGQSQDTVSVYVDRADKVMLGLTEQRENTNLPEGAYTGTVEFPVDKVTVEGPAMVLDKIEKAVVTLDLTGVTKTTTMTCPIRLVDKNGETVTSPYLNYYPAEVDVTVPVLKTVSVPVRAEFRYGFLNEDNARITLTPASVEATGDVEVIDKLALSPTIVFDEKLDFVTGSSKTRTEVLDTPEGVTLSTDTLEAEVTLGSGMKTRTITVPGKNIVDTGGKKNLHYTFEKENVPVTIMGALDQISKIEPDDISLVLDMSPYSKTNTGTITVRAEVKIDSVWADGVIELGAYGISVTFDN